MKSVTRDSRRTRFPLQLLPRPWTRRMQSSFNAGAPVTASCPLLPTEAEDTLSAGGVGSAHVAEAATAAKAAVGASVGAATGPAALETTVVPTESKITAAAGHAATEVAMISSESGVDRYLNAQPGEFTGLQPTTPEHWSLCHFTEAAKSAAAAETGRLLLHSSPCRPSQAGSHADAAEGPGPPSSSCRVASDTRVVSRRNSHSFSAPCETAGPGLAAHADGVGVMCGGPDYLQQSTMLRSDESKDVMMRGSYRSDVQEVEAVEEAASAGEQAATAAAVTMKKATAAAVIAAGCENETEVHETEENQRTEKETPQRSSVRQCNSSVPPPLHQHVTGCFSSVSLPLTSSSSAFSPPACVASYASCFSSEGASHYSSQYRRSLTRSCSPSFCRYLSHCPIPTIEMNSLFFSEALCKAAAPVDALVPPVAAASATEAAAPPHNGAANDPTVPAAAPAAFVSADSATGATANAVPASVDALSSLPQGPVPQRGRSLRVISLEGRTIIREGKSDPRGAFSSVSQAPAESAGGRVLRSPPNCVIGGSHACPAEATSAAVGLYGHPAAAGVTSEDIKKSGSIGLQTPRLPTGINARCPQTTEGVAVTTGGQQKSQLFQAGKVEKGAAAARTPVLPCPERGKEAADKDTEADRRSSVSSMRGKELGSKAVEFHDRRRQAATLGVTEGAASTAGLQQGGHSSSEHHQQQGVESHAQAAAVGKRATGQGLPAGNGGRQQPLHDALCGGAPSHDSATAALLHSTADARQNTEESQRRRRRDEHGRGVSMCHSFRELESLQCARLPLGSFRRTLAHMRYREFIRRHHGIFGTCSRTQCLWWILGCEFLVVTLGLTTCYEKPDGTLVRAFIDAEEVSGKLCIYFFASFGLTLLVILKYGGPLMLRASVYLSQLTCAFLLVTLVALQIRQSVLNNTSCSTAFYSTHLDVSGVTILNGLYSQLQLMFFLGSMVNTLLWPRLHAAWVQNEFLCQWYLTKKQRVRIRVPHPHVDRWLSDSISDGARPWNVSPTKGGSGETDQNDLQSNEDGGGERVVESEGLYLEARGVPLSWSWYAYLLRLLALPGCYRRIVRPLPVEVVYYVGQVDHQDRPHGFGRWKSETYHGETLVGYWNHGVGDAECCVSGAFFRTFPRVTVYPLLEEPPKSGDEIEKHHPPVMVGQVGSFYCGAPVKRLSFFHCDRRNFLHDADSESISADEKYRHNFLPVEGRQQGREIQELAKACGRLPHLTPHHLPDFGIVYNTDAHVTVDGEREDEEEEDEETKPLYATPRIRRQTYEPSEGVYIRVVEKKKWQSIGKTTSSPHLSPESSASGAASAAGAALAVATTANNDTNTASDHVAGAAISGVPTHAVDAANDGGEEERMPRRTALVSRHSRVRFQQQHTTHPEDPLAPGEDPINNFGWVYTAPELSIDGWCRAEVAGIPEVLLFVHGYNTNHVQSTQVMAQMLSFGNFPSYIKPLLFTWPAGQNFTEFFLAQENAKNPRIQLAFRNVVVALRDCGVRQVHIMAHSMGSRLLLGSLRMILQEGIFSKTHDIECEEHSSPEDLMHLVTLIFLNPEYYVDDFVTKEYPFLRQYCNNLSVFCDAHDGWSGQHLLSPLHASGAASCLGILIVTNAYFEGYEPQSMQELKREWLDLDVIDMTWLGHNVHAMRHSYWSLNREVIEDLRELVVTRKRASQRTSRLDRREGNVWVYRVAPSSLTSIFDSDI